MKLTRSEIEHSEIVHYASSTSLITSESSNISVTHQGINRTFAMPDLLWQKPLMPSRLLRRAFRLDKCNVVPILSSSELAALIVIRWGAVYRLEYPSGAITKTLQLRQCRNVLHQSICRSKSGYLFFGEYGANRRRSAVPVYRSKDDGRTWQIIHEFPAGSIKHVHGCYWDKHSERVWVCTGDFAGENIILAADEDFKRVERFGDGSQTWRTCSPFFLSDAVIWPMDSQLEASHLCRYDRATGRLEKLQKFPGPVWYGKELIDGRYLIATASEIGPSVEDRYCHVFVSPDAITWQPIMKVPHDGLPKRYFKFGVIAFADGPQSSAEFYLSCEALSEMDGRSFKCAIESD